MISRRLPLYHDKLLILLGCPNCCIRVEGKWLERLPFSFAYAGVGADQEA